MPRRGCPWSSMLGQANPLLGWCPGSLGSDCPSHGSPSKAMALERHRSPQGWRSPARPGALGCWGEQWGWALHPGCDIPRVAAASRCRLRHGEQAHPSGQARVISRDRRVPVCPHEYLCNLCSTAEPGRRAGVNVTRPPAPPCTWPQGTVPGAAGGAGRGGDDLWDRVKEGMQELGAPVTDQR